VCVYVCVSVSVYVCVCFLRGASQSMTHAAMYCVLGMSSLLPCVCVSVSVFVRVCMCIFFLKGQEFVKVNDICCYALHARRVLAVAQCVCMCVCIYVCVCVGVGVCVCVCVWCVYV